MPRVIFKCPYFKSGNTNIHKENFVKYISTRDGVQKISLQNKNCPATKKQERLITEIEQEFPDTKNLFEYEDYLQNKTMENASEFISIAMENNLHSAAKKENYVDYIANRPRVEKISSHGLFNGGNDEIVLSKVAKEVAEHGGNVWTPIISLRREDAVSTGFDNAKHWKSYLASYVPTLAESMKIPLEQFRWYASFHNESNHPHIHMICYCADARHGYLDKKGIRKIKSGLVSGIFKTELTVIYTEQTKRREVLKAESKKALEDLIREITMGNLQSTQAEKLLSELANQLKNTKGKRVYGYLPPNIKQLVDAITDTLAEEPAIAKAYKLWLETRNKVIGSYRDTVEQVLPLSQQKEFKSIKNHIIYEADQLSKTEISLAELYEIEKFEPIRLDDMEQIYDIDTKKDIPKAKVVSEDQQTPDEIKEALEYLQMASDNENPYAQYTLAKLYYKGRHIGQDTGKAVELLTLSAEQNHKWAAYTLGKIYLTEATYKDIGKGVEWLTKSTEKNNQFAQYRLGKLYLTGEHISADIQKAVEYLTASAEQGNQFAQYILGKMYLIGNGVTKDKETSVKWFTLSAEQGNVYAQFFIDNMDKWKEPSLAFAVTRLMHHMSRIFENNQFQQKPSVGLQIDSKRMKKLREKKIAQGHKEDDHKPQTY